MVSRLSPRTNRPVSASAEILIRHRLQPIPNQSPLERAIRSIRATTIPPTEVGGKGRQNAGVTIMRV